MKDFISHYQSGLLQFPRNLIELSLSFGSWVSFTSSGVNTNVHTLAFVVVLAGKVQ